MKNFKFMRSLLMALLIGVAFMVSGNAIAPTNHTEIAIYAEKAPAITNAPPAVAVAGSKGITAIDAKSYSLASRPMLGIRGQDS
jgi:diphthamide biosynthesis methyltransferase